MHLGTALFTRGNEPGEDHFDDAFLDRDHGTDFKLRFIGTPSERLAWWRFLHSSMVAEAVLAVILSSRNLGSSLASNG